MPLSVPSLSFPINHYHSTICRNIRKLSYRQHKPKCSLFLKLQAVQDFHPRRRIFHQRVSTHVHQHLQGKGYLPSATAILNLKCNKIRRKKKTLLPVTTPTHYTQHLYPSKCVCIPPNLESGCSKGKGCPSPRLIRPEHEAEHSAPCHAQGQLCILYRYSYGYCLVVL
jgi:hypothetical protein